MAARKSARISTPDDHADEISSGQFEQSEAADHVTSSNGKTPSASQAAAAPWPQFIRQASESEIVSRFHDEVGGILAGRGEAISKYTCIGLLDSERSISGFDASRIYSALQDSNPDHDKDVLLLIYSNGGGLEPAYQISKLCKTFSRERFIVTIPRAAKSAATLIALGADQIYMGPLGQLGPIDPQIGGLPALGVSHALKTIASISEQHPGSADMFARYLQMALTVEQIGYCERAGESAVQYAERLLLAKPSLAQHAKKAAHDLVYEYKHHGFVIDLSEAQDHLGDTWISGDSTELSVAEQIYSLFEFVNIFLEILRNKRLIVVGGLTTGALLFDSERAPNT